MSQNHVSFLMTSSVTLSPPLHPSTSPCPLPPSSCDGSKVCAQHDFFKHSGIFGFGIEYPPPHCNPVFTVEISGYTQKMVGKREGGRLMRLEDILSCITHITFTHSIIHFSFHSSVPPHLPVLQLPSPWCDNRTSPKCPWHFTVLPYLDKTVWCVCARVCV